MHPCNYAPLKRIFIIPKALLDCLISLPPLSLLTDSHYSYCCFCRLVFLKFIYVESQTSCYFVESGFFSPPQCLGFSFAVLCISVLVYSAWSVVPFCHHLFIFLLMNIFSQFWLLCVKLLLTELLCRFFFLEYVLITLY